MPSIMPTGKQQFTNNAGVPLAGGKVFTFEAGTTTPKATYQDADGTVENPNPIVLNARGEALAFWHGAYDVKVTDANGLTIYTVSNYQAPVMPSDLSADDGANNIAGTWFGGAKAKLSDFGTQAGAGLIGFSQAGANSVGRTIQDKLRDQVSVFDFMTKAQIADVQSGVAAVDVTTAVQAAINSGASRLHAPKGVYSVSILDLRGKYTTIVGDGIGKTIFRCNTAATAALLNVNEAADVRVSPLVLRDLSLDGAGKAASCLDIRYRHLINLENVYFVGATAQNIKAKDTWLMRGSQCISEGAPVGLWLVGSNHRSRFEAFSFQGNSVWQVKIERAGTAADGNMALVFDNCDVEFATGGGVYIDATDVTLNNCYTGENIDGPVLQVQRGTVSVNGGVLFFGHTTGAFGVLTNGGKTLLRKVGINGQIVSGLGTLLSGTAANSVRFEDCIGNTTIGGGPVINGDLLDYGAQGTVYAKRLGKAFTANSLNATRTNAISGNAQTVTCASVTGAPAVISLQCPLSNNADWRDGEAMYLVMVYESNKGVSVKFSGSSFGGAPSVTVAAGPSTTAVMTLIKLDGVMPSGAYNIVEIYNDSAVVGDYIKLYEFFLADARTMNKGSANWGNLYKC